MAPITIALGPGFMAGKDVDVVIETMRGHKLGRTIYQGTALKIQVYQESLKAMEKNVLSILLMQEL